LISPLRCAACARAGTNAGLFVLRKHYNLRGDSRNKQRENATVTKRNASGVDEYIAKCPKEARAHLAKVRAAIRAAAPGATERTDYFQWPGYSYSDPAFDYSGMFAWFSFKAPHIRLHVRPPVIQDHVKNLSGYSTSKAVVCFPADKPLPVALMKKLVKASVKEMKAKAKSKSKSK
jgi:uncharacterized protein YdhG (YjbR/CyaY superfamily)